MLKEFTTSMVKRSVCCSKVTSEIASWTAMTISAKGQCGDKSLMELVNNWIDSFLGTIEGPQIYCERCNSKLTVQESEVVFPSVLILHCSRVSDHIRARKLQNRLDKDTDASFQDGSDKEDDDTSVESDSSSVNDTDPAAGAILVPDFKNIPDQDDIFATPWGKEHYLKYFPRQTRPSDRHSPFKRTLIRQIVKELEPSTRMILMGTKKSRFVGHIGIIKQLQKVNANLPLENLLDVAYEIEYYLMVLESDVKRQLSLLLSSVNKHIVWPEIITVVLMRTFKLSRHKAIKSYLSHTLPAYDT
ncbi:hypothetical protein EMCRGX_G030152 [Ephydatia muelleri]